MFPKLKVLTTALPILAALVFAVFLLQGPYTYAKGERRSSENSQTTTETRSSETRSSSDRATSGHSSPSSPSSSRVEHGSSRSESTRSSSDSGWTLMNPSSRSTESRDRRDVFDSRGAYRKDYESLGQIWRERHERRDTTSDSFQRGSAGRSSVFVFPGSYRYYCYDYLPDRVYPSLYCYYYGLFPPYIYGTRIVYVYRGPTRFTYVDLPIILILQDCRDRDSSYYLETPYFREHCQYHSLSETLRDIERAWERRDPDLLMKHVRPFSTIDVFLDDEYSYSVDWQDYRDMTLDAMKNIRTTSFNFYRLRERSNSDVVAYGKHTYRDEYDPRPASLMRTSYYLTNASTYHAGGIEKTVYVTYTIERRGTDWYIKEVGCSPHRYY